MKKNFDKSLEKLGFKKTDECLILLKDKKTISDPEVCFHSLRAKEFEADAIYLRRQLGGSYKPQVYIYDFTDQVFQENTLTNIQKKIWSSGEVPLVCVFYATEIKILDCTKSINIDDTPVYLEKNLSIVGTAHKLYNEQFAIKIKSGLFWEEKENKDKFNFQNSSYEKLIENIKIIIKDFKKRQSSIPDKLINKIIIQSILIKYLEERIDTNGNKLLSNRFFKKYDNSVTFNDVLRKKGKFVDLLDELNDKQRGFNGNVFHWEKSEKEKLKELDLTILSELLDTNRSLNDNQYELWRYFEFKYIPVELISRLYEEFLVGSNEKGEKGRKKESGIYYTPSHLAKLMTDEAISLKKYKEIDLDSFTILDPACGSGIFLVTVFKRLAQIWRLQNNLRSPQYGDLKKILHNIYGIDREEEAVKLTSFSLCIALCNELEPLEIINKLKFEDLTETNIIHSDFFVENKLSKLRFNLIIGNPPFIQGSIKEYKNNIWKRDNMYTSIPDGQIALKFLASSIDLLKPNALIGMIIKSSSLLYNTRSLKFKSMLFLKTNVLQILDFTALAEGKYLWDNGARVGCAAIFIRNENPDFKKNILHITFKRNKAIRDRIYFEVDDYDIHFVNRQDSINNKFIWKINLLGGGRIKNAMNKLSQVGTLGDYVKNNASKIIVGEGAINGKTLPNEAFLETKIDYRFMNSEYEASYKELKEKRIFDVPNLLIKENIELPFTLNSKRIKFSDQIVSFHSKDKIILETMQKTLKLNRTILKFFAICSSSKLLVIKDTALKKEDIINLPFEENINLEKILSHFDLKVINDVTEIMQTFLRYGKNSKALEQISDSDYDRIISNYGAEFSNAMNLIYEDDSKKFRLSDVIKFGDSFIATIFKYDSMKQNEIFHYSNDNLNLKYLSLEEVSKHLSVNRIIKLYPEDNTIVFIKPNQYRYWLSLTAYRDADKCFADLSEAGY